MSLFIGLLMSSVGLGYFVYGKKSSDIQFMLTGIALMVYPYFFQDVMAIVIIGLILLLVPFLMKKFDK